MSKLLDYLRAGMNNPDIQAVREWKTVYGEIGVYYVEADNVKYVWKCYYLAILTRAGRTYTQQYGVESKATVLHDADVIAAFAGAELIEE